MDKQLEQSPAQFLRLPGLPASLGMMLCIIGQMTLLAQGPQVLRRTVLRLMIQVSDGEHHLRSVIADGVVLHPAELAAVPCPIENMGTDLLPVLRIPSLVFGTDGHLTQKN